MTVDRLFIRQSLTTDRNRGPCISSGQYGWKEEKSTHVLHGQPEPGNYGKPLWTPTFHLTFWHQKRMGRVRRPLISSFRCPVLRLRPVPPGLDRQSLQLFKIYSPAKVVQGHSFSECLYCMSVNHNNKNVLALPVGELNPGLPRDRRGY